MTPRLLVVHVHPSLDSRMYVRRWLSLWCTR